MKESILSHVAANFISEYENVANSSICYLLNKYPASREALKSLLKINEVPTCYTTELSTKENGRPDVTGTDENENKIIIIEGKFWASLTPNQPRNYLNELKKDGKILFLVPNKRVESLKIEIQNKLEKEDDRVYIFSWNSFLDLISLENNKDYNDQLHSDLLQIKELCKKMDVEGIAPLSDSDLDPMHGKLIYNFVDIIDECNYILREWDKTDFKGLKTTPVKGGYGFYFKAFKFGCNLNFSSYDWFMKASHTPIWLIIKDSSWKKSGKLYNKLNKFDKKNSYDEKEGSMYGIVLETGWDKQRIVKHIVEKTKEVLCFLEKDINGVN